MFSLKSKWFQLVVSHARQVGADLLLILGGAGLISALWYAGFVLKIF